MVNLWPRFLCQNVRIAEIEVYAKIQLLLTMCWSKSTLVKPAVETLAAAGNVFVLLPRVNRRLPPSSSNQWEVEREICVMRRWVKCPPTLTLFISITKGVTHLLGYKTLKPTCTYLNILENKFKINVLLIRSRWSLDQSCTSPKEEPNKNIGIFIWASQHGVFDPVVQF